MRGVEESVVSPVFDFATRPPRRWQVDQRVPGEAMTMAPGRSSGKGAYLEGHGALVRIRYRVSTVGSGWRHRGLGRRIVARPGLGSQEGPYKARGVIGE